MKTIGLLGGTSWESTIEYYRIINKEVSNILGHDHSAKIIMFSIDYFEIIKRNERNDFEGLKNFIIDISKKIEAAGADCILLGANTLHMFADDVSESISVPLVHIADATAEKIKELGYCKAGLIGTKLTMEKDFYRKRLSEKFGIETLIPEENERSFLHNTIINELIKGIFKPGSKAEIIKIIESLKLKGAECVILGCTEIPLIIQQQHTNIPLIDTLDMHAKAAVKFALS